VRQAHRATSRRHLDHPLCQPVCRNASGRNRLPSSQFAPLWRGNRLARVSRSAATGQLPHVRRDDRPRHERIPGACSPFCECGTTMLGLVGTKFGDHSASSVFLSPLSPICRPHGRFDFGLDRDGASHAARGPINAVAATRSKPSTSHSVRQQRRPQPAFDAASCQPSALIVFLGCASGSSSRPERSPSRPLAGVDAACAALAGLIDAHHRRRYRAGSATNPFFNVSHSHHSHPTNRIAFHPSSKCRTTTIAADRSAPTASAKMSCRLSHGVTATADCAALGQSAKIAARRPMVDPESPRLTISSGRPSR